MIKTRVFYLAALVILLSGCAHHYATDVVSDPYGFWSGIWHGIIFPYSLVANILSWLASLLGVDFLSQVEIIGRPNTGLWYYVGFVLGLAAYPSGGAGTRLAQ